MQRLASSLFSALCSAYSRGTPCKCVFPVYMKFEISLTVPYTYSVEDRAKCHTHPTIDSILYIQDCWKQSTHFMYTNREFNFFFAVWEVNRNLVWWQDYAWVIHSTYGMHLIHSKTSRLHRLHATNKSKVICKTLYIYTMKLLLIPLHTRCSVEYYSLSRLFYAIIVSGAHQPCHYQLNCW